MSFDEVITLDGDQAAQIGDILIAAAAHQVRVRVAIDDGGVKLAAGRESWTPPIGTLVSRDERAAAWSAWLDAPSGDTATNQALAEAIVNPSADFRAGEA